MPFESELELRHRPGHHRWEVILPLHCRHEGPARLSTSPISFHHCAGRLAFGPGQRATPGAPAGRQPDPRQMASIDSARLYLHLRINRFSEREAHRIFYDALLEEGNAPTLVWLMWKAVCLGGRGNWGQHIT